VCGAISAQVYVKRVANHGISVPAYLLGLCMHACMRKPIQQQGRDVNTRKRRILGRPRIPPSSFQGSMDGVLRGPGKESERVWQAPQEKGRKKQAIEWEKAAHGVGGSALLVGSLSRRGNLN
jgi:hypothetical protein